MSVAEKKSAPPSPSTSPSPKLLASTPPTPSATDRRLRRPAGRSALRWSAIVGLALFTFVAFATITDAFQLRDLKDATAAAAAAAGGGAKPARKVFKDMPMRKITRIVKDIDPDELSGKVDSDGNPIVRPTAADDESGDDESGDAEEPPFVFEKVHTTHFDLPARPVAKLSQPDVEQEAEEAKEEEESGEQVSSLFDPVWQVAESVLGYTPTLDVSGTLEWLQSFRRQEEGAKVEADASAEEEAAAEAPGFWSYLDRKPFNLLLRYIGKEYLLHRDRAEVGEEERAASSEERMPLSSQQFENLLLTVPSFVPNYAELENVECRRMGQIFQRQVRGEKMWALQMMDATGRIPSGLLRGNANQLGDFDQCLDIRTKVKLKEDKSVKIKGKYCLANIDVEATVDALRLPVHLAQGRNMLRSHLDDPAHYLPRFSTLKWAMCLPNACQAADAAIILTDFLSKFNETAGLLLKIRIEDEDCVLRTRRSWSDLIKANWQMSVAIGYFMFFGVVTVIASLNDYWQVLRLDVLLADPNLPAPETADANAEEVEDSAMREEDETGNGATAKSSRKPSAEAEEVASTEVVAESKSEEDCGTKCETCNEDHGFTHRMLMSFSLKQTTRQLFSFEPAEQDDDQVIYCIYGLKGLATVLLFFSLKVLVAGHIPFSNRAQMTELLNTPASVFLRVAGVLYSDVFLMASGFFAGYKMHKDIEVRFRIPWLRRIGARCVRLLPSVLATVLFTGWIWPHLGAGPQWAQLVGKPAQLCRESPWPHLLFLQNLLPAHEQCAPHLAHIAVDMQLYVLAPAIIWLLERNVALGFGVFGVLNAFSVGLRFARTVNERLSVVVFHGMKLTQFYRTINITLASPLQRATAHLIGLGLGVMLSQAGRDVQIPKAIFVTGWITCLWSLVWCFWAPAHLAHKDYVYDPADAAQYSTWAPLMWALALAWIIFVVFTRNDGLMTRCLTVRPLIFLSRISYQVFCVQMLVLLWGAAQVRSADTFSWGTLFDVQEIALVLVAAIVCTLVFDLPLQSISRMILAQGIDEDIAAEAERIQREADDEAKAAAEAEKGDAPVSDADESDRETGVESDEAGETEHEEPADGRESVSPVEEREEEVEVVSEEEKEEADKATENGVQNDSNATVNENEKPADEEVEDDVAEEEEEGEDEADGEEPISRAATNSNSEPAGGESRARFEDEYDDLNLDDDDEEEGGIEEITDEDYSGSGRGSTDDYSDEEADLIRAQIWRNNF